MTDIILVVDDDPQVRRAIQWALEDEGFVVKTAEDGPEALAIALDHPPALVVLDVTLPILDGFEVARVLAASETEPPRILAVTGDGQAPLKAARLGAYAYVRKPFDVVDLVAEVRRGLRV
jgi:DNA-binding response OmpR family regulator